VCGATVNPPGAGMHADRRGQYHAKACRNALARSRIRPNCAVSATGSPRQRCAEAGSTTAPVSSWRGRALPDGNIGTRSARSSRRNAGRMR